MAAKKKRAKRKMSGPAKRRKLAKIRTLARRAYLQRLRGNIPGAMKVEGQVDSLIADASKKGFGSSASDAEESGHAKAAKQARLESRERRQVHR